MIKDLATWYFDNDGWLIFTLAAGYLPWVIPTRYSFAIAFGFITLVIYGRHLA